MTIVDCSSFHDSHGFVRVYVTNGSSESFKELRCSWYLRDFSFNDTLVISWLTWWLSPFVLNIVSWFVLPVKSWFFMCELLLHDAVRQLMLLYNDNALSAFFSYHNHLTFYFRSLNLKNTSPPGSWSPAIVVPCRNSKTICVQYCASLKRRVNPCLQCVLIKK